MIIPLPENYVIGKDQTFYVVVLLVISSMMNLTAALAVEVGSSEDPLVTLSYLNEVFLKCAEKRRAQYSPAWQSPLH